MAAVSHAPAYWRFATGRRALLGRLKIRPFNPCSAQAAKLIAVRQSLAAFFAIHHFLLKERQISEFARSKPLLNIHFRTCPWHNLCCNTSTQIVAVARLTLCEALYSGFGFSYNAALPYMKFIALFLLSEVFGGYGIFVRLVSNFFSRKDEYEADAYAKKLCGSGKPLSSALIALNRENNGEVRTAKIYNRT